MSGERSVPRSRPRSVEEHRAAVEELVGALVIAGAETVAVRDALGRVLAAPVATPVDLPLFDNSQMDGYAVAAASLEGATDAAPVVLPITGHVAAGHGVSAFRGGAVEIMTGAPLPVGADAVVPVEEVALVGARVSIAPAAQSTGGGGTAAVDGPAGTTGDGSAGTAVDGPAGTVVDGPAQPAGTVVDGPAQPADGDHPAPAVAFRSPVAPGTFIRRRGSDLPAGAELLPAAVRLGPSQLGALAAAGITEVDVIRRPRVLVISTGLELVAPGEAAGDGQVFDANAAALAASVAEAGGQARTMLVPTDEPAAFLAVLDAAPVPDLVITTGGVSVGAHEVVRQALEPRGVWFGSVAVQPGGPQGLGTVELGGRRVPIVCFPGNPVSALVSFDLFLRSKLRTIAGLRPAKREKSQALLAEAVDSPEFRAQFRRGVLLDDGTVSLQGGSSSHLIAAYARSNALVHIPAGVAHLDAGAEVEVWRIDD